uniref:Uncharacterized protein n=1 Tax=Salix viminalis TaxID=40686 RepID=A0A6N2LGY5_SALVM
MADSSVSIDKLKAFWHSQVHDEEKWALNMEQPTLGETNSDEFVVDSVIDVLANTAVAVDGLVLFFVNASYIQLTGISCFKSEISMPFGKSPGNVLVFLPKLSKKLLQAVGLFAGSIFLMRNYGDLMAI